MARISETPDLPSDGTSRVDMQVDGCDDFIFSRKQQMNIDQILICTHFPEGSGSVLLSTCQLLQADPLFGSVTLDVFFYFPPKTCSESKNFTSRFIIPQSCRVVVSALGSLLGPNLYGVMGRTAAMNQRTGRFVGFQIWKVEETAGILCVFFPKYEGVIARTCSFWYYCNRKSWLISRVYWLMNRWSITRSTKFIVLGWGCCCILCLVDVVRLGIYKLCQQDVGKMRHHFVASNKHHSCSST